VVKALCYKPEGHGSRLLSAALGPGVCSTSIRNEYQKQRINFSGSRARPVRRAYSLVAVCELIV
jgi:hypothetical protein